MNTCKIMNGKILAEKMKNNLERQIKDTINGHRRPPVLATVLVGDNPSSKTYVAMKQRDATQVGIETMCFYLPEDKTETEIIALIKTLNEDPTVDGILLQLPLPAQFEQFKVIESISPSKDVDGLTSASCGFLMNRHEDHFVTCTPAGILHLLMAYHVPLMGAQVVIINHSSVVGRPLSQLLLNRGATVTICHSKTKDLAIHTRTADILITAVGKPVLITADMVKEGSIVIDAGYARVNGKLCGDTDYESICDKVSLITPPIGGVGPMTIAYLLYNTVLSWSRTIELIQ